MNLEHAETILSMIEASAEDSLRGDLMRLAIDYARLRTDWQLCDRLGRQEVDPHRSRVHDALIDACNILARAMRARGEDGSWRQELGDDRKRMGDWACLVHALLGLRAR